MSTLHSCKSCGFPAEVITGGTSCWVSCMNPDCNQATDSFDLDEVVEAIDTWNAQFGVKHELRAQADARPVAEWQVRYMGDPRQPGIWNRSNNPDWCERQYKAIGSTSNSAGYQVRPLYTHPEASAPGLSDDERDAIDRAIRLLVRECGATGTASHLRAILTRASAVTVVEPSAYEHVAGPRVPEIDRVLAAQQQAEPGADERAAWEYSFIHSSATGRPDEKVGPCLTYDKDQAFGVGCIEQRAVRVSAAQSGQRARIKLDIECPCCDAKLTAHDTPYGPGVAVRQSGQRASATEPEGWRGFITEVAQQKPEKPDHWSPCGQCQHNADRAQDLIAAAPTQQQEGGS